MRLILGLHGLPGSGKDMLADYLVANHGFIKMAFADTLKEELCDAFGVPLNLFTDRILKLMPNEQLTLSKCKDSFFAIAEIGRCDLDEPRTPRWIMQHWGDFRRRVTPTYFIAKLRNKIAAAPMNQPVVVTDVRYPNERNFLKNHYEHSRIIEVHRPFNPYCESTDGHASNTMLSPTLIDRVIGNDGPPEFMFEQIEQALKIFHKGY